MTAFAHSTALLHSMRPQRMQAETFEAFAIADSGRVYRTEAHDADTLEQTLASLCVVYGRGEKVMVRQTDTLTGKALLKFYTVREKAPQWMKIGFETKRVSKRYAEHLFDVRPETLL
jgi:hypothetical protein